MTEVCIVDYILEQDGELMNTYNLYQNILYSLQYKDYTLFSKIIENNYENISNYILTSLNTSKKISIYIKNKLEQPYSNRIIEGNNNTCKLIKQIAFGTRNFKNLKARIMIVVNLFRNSKNDTEFPFSTL